MTGYPWLDGETLFAADLNAAFAAGAHIGGPFVQLSGATMTGPLTLFADPTAPFMAATKQYVDAFAGGGSFLPISGGTLTGNLSVGGALGVTGSLTASSGFNAIGTALFGPATNKQVQIIGGAAQAFVNSVGGPLTFQSASGNNINLNPLGTGTSVTINGALVHNLFGNGVPPLVGSSINAAGFTMQTDSAVVASGQAVNWVGIGGNLGALPWQASTAVTVNATRNNGGRVYICRTAGTTAASGGPTGTGTGITDGAAVWDYQSSDHVGIRNGLFVSLNLRSPAGPTAVAQQKQWPAIIGTFTASANQGGTDTSTGNALGAGYAGADQSWLYAGATNFQAIAGREIDVGIFTGGSAKSRYGLNIVSYGNVFAALDDTAINFGSTYAGGSTGIPFGNLFLLGEGAVQTGTQALLSYHPRPNGALSGATYANPVSVNGFDVSNIRFTNAAFVGPGGTKIDGQGAVIVGAAKLSASTTAALLDVSGYVVTAVPSVDGSAPAPLGFRPGDQVYEADGLGTIITINTVDGSGIPLTWTLTIPGSTLGTVPTNPVTFYGGSGSSAVRFNLTWTNQRGLSIQPTAGGTLGFYGSTPVAKQTGVAVTVAAVHAALTSLGLIAP